MTDNEIIKALEYDQNSEFEKDAIDLINRQKAEIERLREIRDLCNTTILEKSELIEKLKISDASKEECTIRQHGEIKELKSEIERLTSLCASKDVIIASQEAEIEMLNEKVDFVADIDQLAKTIKAEAVKEFAEGLKKEMSFGRYIQADQIDNIAKELIGGE
jgi:hypothetical protein